VQYALTELFETRLNQTQRQQSLITHKSYVEIGGVTGALERRAEKIYQELEGEQQEATRQLFLRLVNLGEGVEDTRRRALLSELGQLAGQGNSQSSAINSQRSEIARSSDRRNPKSETASFRTPHSALALYGAARLLVFDRDSQSREPTVEVAHEALLHEWGRLRTWLDESRGDVRLQRLLAVSAAEWEGAGRNEGYLLRGARLSQYEAWQAETSVALTQSEKDFLEASLAARQHRKAEESARAQRELETVQQLAQTERQRAEEGEQAARSLRRRALFLAGALAVAAMLAAAALFAWRQARDNAALAGRSALEAQSLALASGAQAALADDDTDQALMLALAAHSVADPPALAQEVLYEAALSPGTVRRIVGGGGWRWAMDVHPATRLVASGADDMKVTIWDLDSGEELMVLDGEHSESIGDVVFTPDGRRLLSGAYDDTLILWDLENGQAIQRMQNPTGDVNSVAISGDGELAMAGTEGGVATLWDLDSAEMIGELTHNPELQVLAVVFSDDGNLAATGSEDGSVIIWDMASREPLHSLQVLDNVLFALAFSPDGADQPLVGRMLAAGGMGDAVHLYDVQTGEQIGALGGLPDWVFDLDFSDDGSQLLAGSRDGSMLLWDVAALQLLHTYIGKDGRTLDVELVAGNTAVSSASTGNLRLWDLEDGRLRAKIDAGDFVASTATSPDGRLAALGLNQAIRLVDLPTGETVSELALPGGDDAAANQPVFNRGDVTALAFDPAGERLLSATDGGELALWDVSQGREIRRFAGHDSRIHDLVFSPDGRSFLSVADDQQLILWDVETGNTLFTYKNPSDTINSVAFSPDGQSFAAGMGTFRFAAAPIDPEQIDSGIIIWESGTGRELTRLDGHEGPVMALAFSPDGRRLLSGSIDTTLRLWDVAAREPVRRFDGHTSGIMSLDLDDSGRYAASGAQDGTVIVWDMETGDLMRQIAAHQGVVHSVAFGGAGIGAPQGELWSAAEDGVLKLWNLALDRDQLMAWAQNNRYIPEFSCEQRARYGLDAGAECALTAAE
jgi:WD40 repeat protein